VLVQQFCTQDGVFMEGMDTLTFVLFNGTVTVTGLSVGTVVDCVSTKT